MCINTLSNTIFVYQYLIEHEIRSKSNTTGPTHTLIKSEHPRGLFLLSSNLLFAPRWHYTATTCRAWCESRPEVGSSRKMIDGVSRPISCKPIASLRFSPPDMPSEELFSPVERHDNKSRGGKWGRRSGEVHNPLYP